MRTYSLIANNNQGASVKFSGNSMADCKNQFANQYEITDFVVRIYDEQNGAFVQLKPMGQKTYRNPA